MFTYARSCIIRDFVQQQVQANVYGQRIQCAENQWATVPLKTLALAPIARMYPPLWCTPERIAATYILLHKKCLPLRSKSSGTP